ncbi:MAG: hypothetical protein IPM93_21330 [Candidatus Obscuribacter sp.]|nr:hypothetical protein [Candidatus Obscuribacter sp.]
MFTPKNSLWENFLTIIFFIPVTTYQLLRESGEWLWKRIRRANGWERSLVVGVVGLPISGASAWQVANLLAFHYGLGGLSWFFCFIVSAVLIWSHAWSSLYYFGLRHVWNLGEKAFKQWDRFCRNGLHPMLRALTDWTRQAPGANKLWLAVEGEDGRSGTAVRVLEVIAGVSIFGGAAYTGYLTYGAVTATALVDSGTLMMILGLTAAATVFGSIMMFFISMAEGKAPAIVAAYSALLAGATAYAATQFPLVSQTPVSNSAGIALGVFDFFVNVTYVLPLAISLMQSGTIKRLVERWFDLIKDSYAEEENKDFQRFYQHALNLTLAPVLGFTIYIMATASALPVWSAALLAAATAIYSYCEAFRKRLNSYRCNLEMGTTIVFLAGAAAFTFMPAANAAISVAWAIGSMVFTYLFAYPAFYLTTRMIATRVNVGTVNCGTLGLALEKLHGSLSASVTAMFEALRTKRREAFDDNTDFSALFGHVLNLVIVATAVYSGTPVAMDYLTSSFWLNAAIAFFVATNGFVLLGKLFSSYSAHTWAAVLGLSSAAATGYYSYQVSDSVVTSVVLAAAVADIAAYVVAPLSYLAVRNVTAGFTPGLAKFARDSFDAIWSIYVRIWAAIGTRFAIVMTILAPIFASIINACRAVSATVSRIFGH